MNALSYLILGCLGAVLLSDNDNLIFSTGLGFVIGIVVCLILDILVYRI